MNNQFKNLIYSVLAVLSISLTSCEKEDPQPTPSSQSNFCYSFDVNTMPYDSIRGGTNITNLNADGFYEIDLGFQFNLCEQSYSKLYILEDYYSPTFTYQITATNIDVRKYYFLANGDLFLEPKLDANFNDISRIIKKTEGSTGNLVTTLEFRNLVYDDFDTQTYFDVNYKIIFRESDNSVSYHYGPTNLTKNFANDRFEQLAVGLYSTAEADGLFLKGNPDNPTTVRSGFNSELNTWPKENTLYKFTKK